MFLNELNKEEAMAFVNLISEFAESDNDFAEEEKELISRYKKELHINEGNIQTLSHDEIIKTLEKSSDRIKRIIYFELIGLALIDGEYQENEVDFLDNIAEKLGVSRANKIAFANYFFTYTDIYDLEKVNSENNMELLKAKAEEVINK